MAKGSKRPCVIIHHRHTKKDTDISSFSNDPMSITGCFLNACQGWRVVWETKFVFHQNATFLVEVGP